MVNVNVDFEFDFEKAISRAYHEDETHQAILDIAKGIDIGAIDTEKAIWELIKINSSVFAEVLKQYNQELLNEI